MWKVKTREERTLAFSTIVDKFEEILALAILFA